MVASIGSAALKLIAAPRAALAGLDRMGKGMRDLNKSAKRSSSGFKALNKSITGSILKANLITGAFSRASAGIGSILGDALDFEQATANIRAFADASAGQMDVIKQRARELGAETQFGATDAANGMLQMVKAGMSVEEAMEGVGHALNMAMIAGIDVNQAADLTTNIMSTMGLKAKDLTSTIDVLSRAMALSPAGMDELGESFKFAGALASEFDMSLNKVVEALTVFSNAGVRGTKAGTDLRRLLLNLTAPTAEAAKVMDKAGIKAADAAGNFIGLARILPQFQQATAGMGNADRTKFLEPIFGQMGLPTFLTLLKQTPAELARVEKALAMADGTAGRMRKTMEDTTKGALLRLKSAAQDVGIAFLENFGPKISATLDDLSGWIRSNSPQIEKFFSDVATVYLPKFVGFLGDVVNVAKKVVQALGWVIDKVSAIGDAIDARVEFVSKALGWPTKQSSLFGELDALIAKRSLLDDPAIHKAFETAITVDVAKRGLAGLMGPFAGLAATGQNVIVPDGAMIKSITPPLVNAITKAVAPIKQSMEAPEALLRGSADAISRINRRDMKSREDQMLDEQKQANKHLREIAGKIGGGAAAQVFEMLELK